MSTLGVTMCPKGVVNDFLLSADYEGPKGGLLNYKVSLCGEPWGKIKPAMNDPGFL